jgi:hypothetical protein
MENKKIVRFAAPILIAGVCLQGCGFLAPATPNPTATSTPTATFTLTTTFTATSTATAVPTNTPLPANTPTQKPTPACGIADSSWASREQTDTFGASQPLLTFQVAECEIIQVEITAYPAPGELFWSPYGGLHAALQNQTFRAVIDDQDLGTLTVAGKFRSATACQGTIEFPKGFLVFDYVLPAAVILPWNAAPI